MWAALLEGVCVFVASAVIGATILAIFNISAWAVEEIINSEVQEKTAEVQAEKVKYERIITACLNGGLIYLDGKARPCSI